MSTLTIRRTEEDQVQGDPVREDEERAQDEPAEAEDHSHISQLLALPRELRDQIFLPLLQLSPGYSTPPSQPHITFTCHQLRSETLPAFYAINTFRFQLDFTTLLAQNQAWLKRTGNANVELLRKVELVGWRRIPFGHMFRRVKIVISVDLRAGQIDIGGEGELESEDVKAVRKRFDDGKELGWDVVRLGELMEAFWSGCADNY